MKFCLPVKVLNITCDFSKVKISPADIARWERSGSVVECLT